MADAAAPSNTPEFTVGELAGAIKRALEDDFGYVRLRGEVSGYRGPALLRPLLFRAERLHR